MKVSLVTCRDLPGLDEDGPSLLEALARVGMGGEPTVWDDADVDWAGFDLVVLRSAWDYPPRRDEFLAWADRVASTTRLFNPARVIRWNTDKVYLRELTRAGVPVVDTVWWDGRQDLPDWPDLVVKPSVSAGCKDTGRFGLHETRRAFELAERIRSGGRQVMVQPYLSAIEDTGETALIYFGGQYSHAIRKGALLLPGGEPEEGLFREESIEARTATAAERDVAEAALEAMPFPREELLYARIDTVPDAQGRPRLIELELAEPSLFLGYSQAAADRLAAALVERS